MFLLIYQIQKALANKITEYLLNLSSQPLASSNMGKQKNKPNQNLSPEFKNEVEKLIYDIYVWMRGNDFIQEERNELEEIYDAKLMEKIPPSAIALSSVPLSTHQNKSLLQYAYECQNVKIIKLFLTEENIKIWESDSRIRGKDDMLNKLYLFFKISLVNAWQKGQDDDHMTYNHHISLFTLRLIENRDLFPPEEARFSTERKKNLMVKACGCPNVPYALISEMYKYGYRLQNSDISLDTHKTVSVGANFGLDL